MSRHIQCSHTCGCSSTSRFIFRVSSKFSIGFNIFSLKGKFKVRVVWLLCFLFWYKLRVMASPAATSSKNLKLKKKALLILFLNPHQINPLRFAPIYLISSSFILTFRFKKGKKVVAASKWFLMKLLVLLLFTSALKITFTQRQKFCN